MRRTLAAATAAAAALLTPAFAPPASALAAGVLVCPIRYGTPSGPNIPGSSTCSWVGYSPNGSLTNTVTLSFTALNACPVGAAGGTITGNGINIGFTWTRVGPAAVMKTQGNANGAGVVAFTSACPTQGETAVITFAGI